jgi:transcriptional regulator with XRE-family HTH domain
MCATTDDGTVRLPQPLHVAYRHHVPGSPKSRGEQFAALIRDARTVAGITQDALADQAGVNRSTIIRWEGGDASRPDPDQVRRVCRALGVDPRRAAVALGYLSPEDIDPVGTARTNPHLEEVLAILEDPAVPQSEKENWIDYLRFLQVRARERGRRTG